MKFLDQAKIFIKAGNGGSVQPVLEEKSLLNLEGLMAVMEAEADPLYYLQITI